MGIGKPFSPQDASKQAISAAVAHWVNMALAVILSENKSGDNCDWYFINISVDVILGIVISYFIIKQLQRLGNKLKIQVRLTDSIDF